MKKLLAPILIGALLLTGLGASSAFPATKVAVVAAPKINSYATVGTKVTATLAKFNVKASKVALEWLYNGKVVPKSTATSFVIKAAQSTGTLQLRETATVGTTKKVLVSNKINIGQLFVVTKPTLAYTDGTNTTLAFTPGTVLPAPVSVTNSWVRDGATLLVTPASLTREVQTADRGSVMAARSVFKAPTGYADLTVNGSNLTITSTSRVYEQLWSDEFNGAAGATVDPANWVGQDGDGIAFENRGWGNNERQWYRFENATTDGSGVLNILASRTGASSTACYYGPCEFYSSKLVTKDKVGFTYGRLEARIKGAPGNGTWGAFWTLGSNIDLKGWPLCGEIDVIELIGRDPKAILGYSHGPVTWGGGRGNTIQAAEDWANTYHTFSIDWLPDQLTWYMDGVKYGTVSKTDRDWVFDKEQYMILNLAMGGNLGGEIDVNLNESTMKVDYVRFSSINGIGTVTRY
jgi:beta-glucanase (GH16 family)